MKNIFCEEILKNAEFSVYIFTLKTRTGYLRLAETGVVREFSVVRSTGCSSRELELGLQHLQATQLPITSIPADSTPCFGFCNA